MQYRPEIDGLRAIAVVPVILFHAGVEIFAGGFVGVDVFFVISGYLITSIIIREMEQGKFSVRRFYVRRARRILPALFFVMLCCIPFAWMWMVPSQFEDFSQSLVATTLFSSNIWFWRETGYFESAVEITPLIHTWSLAVEEQYYVVFPILLIALWRFGRRPLFYAVIAIAIASLLLSEWSWRNSPSANFYLAPSRVWELLVGSICALLQIRREQKSNNALSVLGLALILVSIFYYDQNTPFPSIYTLTPVIGTALIIMFSAKGTWIAHFLSTRVFVGVGLISYSAYLWHQPLFAFAHIQGIYAPEQWLKLLLASASFVLAYFSWRFVERPFRINNRLSSRFSIYTLSMCFGISIISFGVYGYLSNGIDSRAAMSTDIASQKFSSSVAYQDITDKCYDDVSFARHVNVVCHAYFSESNEQTIAVYGDSHSQAMLPSFNKLSKKHNINIASIAMNGCPPILGVYVISGYQENGVCNELAQKQFEYAVNNNIKMVFLVARWGLYTYGEYSGAAKKYLLSQDSKPLHVNMEKSKKVFAISVSNTVNAYTRSGIDVVFVEQVPEQLVDPKLIAEKLKFLRVDATEVGEIVGGTSVESSVADAQRAFSRSVFNEQVSGNTHVLNFDRLFQRDGKYYWGNDFVSYYSDHDHLSVSGAELLAPFILEQFELISQDWVRSSN